MTLRQIATGVSALLMVCTLACAGTQATESGDIMAQGESFQNLTIITDDFSPSSEPSVGPDGAVIFSSKKDGNWDIYMKPNPTAKAIRKLTNHGAADRNPNVSPDGTQVAFASNRSGNYDIFILRTDGGTAKRQVTDSNDDEVSPDWAPDGSKIAYSRYSRMDGQYYIWVKDLNTDANVQLGPGINPRFSPDGSKILFQKASKTGQKYFGLWTMDLNGANMTQLVASEEWGAIQGDWSPDGNKIIFATSKGLASTVWQLQSSSASQNEKAKEDIIVSEDGVNLWVMNPDGAQLTQLTTHPKDDTWPVWTSDNLIYFRSLRDGKQRIWRFTPVLPDGYVPAAPAAVAEEPAVEPAAETPEAADKPVEGSES